MAGWDDLLVDAQPALLGGGLIHEGFTEGTTWVLELLITDSTNTPVPWTGITVEGFLYGNREGDAPIAVVLDATLPSAGHVLFRKEAADTGGQENPNGALGLFLINSTGPERIAICLPHNSPCPIKSED
jgi:hypothetical protein